MIGVAQRCAQCVQLSFPHCSRSYDSDFESVDIHSTTTDSNAVRKPCTTQIQLGQVIAKLTVSQEQGKLLVRIFGSGSPSLIDWGKIPIESIYAKDVNSAEPMGFTCFARGNSL